MNTLGIIVAITIVLIILVVAWYFTAADNMEDTCKCGDAECEGECADVEPLQHAPPMAIPTTMNVQDSQSWIDRIIETELDPSIQRSHSEFTKEVKRFSSQAGFTSVTDDNTNSAFSNYIGLRKPQHVPIGASARSIPDVDESVLQRNRPFNFQG